MQTTIARKLRGTFGLNKDRSYGGLILVISIIVFIVYIIALTNDSWRAYAIDVPIVLGVLGILGITGWIGWTMLTTPPPAPLEADLGATPSTSTTTGTSSMSGSAKPDEKR